VNYTLRGEEREKLSIAENGEEVKNRRKRATRTLLSTRTSESGGRESDFSFVVKEAWIVSEHVRVECFRIDVLNVFEDAVQFENVCQHPPEALM